MASVTREKAMTVPKKCLFQAITDFAAYPDFLPEVVSAVVRPGGTPERTVVDFELEVIRRFQYTLEFKITGEEEVVWKLVDSNFFKVNDGRWKLTAANENITQVEYELDVGFGFLVPKMITRKLTAINLPRMFDQFEVQAKSLHSKG